MVAAPRLLSAWLLALFTLALLARSLWPEPPLAERPGFAAALEALRPLAAGRFVLVHPPSQAAALEKLPAAWTAGDALPAEPEDARVWPELVVLSAAGSGTPIGLEGATRAQEQTYDGVSVTLYRFEVRDRVLYDLARDLAGVRVRLDGEPPVECDLPRQGGGHACPGQPEWNTVEPRVITVAGHAWPAVWAHPRSGRRLVLELGELALGARLELQAALADGAVGGGSSVRLLVEVDGVAVRELVRSDARGVATLVVPTPAGERHAVRLIVTTAEDGRRHLGVRLRLLSPVGGAS